MQSTRKTNLQPARSHKSSKSSCQRFDKIDIYILLCFSWWLGVYIQGHATFCVHGLRSLDHWLWFHPPMYLCVYHISLQHGHRWCWSCFFACTENKFFQNMNSQSPWSANAYRDAHNAWLVHWGLSGLMGLPEAVHHTCPIQSCEPRNIQYRQGCNCANNCWLM